MVRYTKLTFKAPEAAQPLLFLYVLLELSDVGETDKPVRLRQSPLKRPFALSRPRRSPSHRAPAPAPSRFNLAPLIPPPPCAPITHSSLPLL